MRQRKLRSHNADKKSLRTIIDWKGYPWKCAYSQYTDREEVQVCRSKIQHMYCNLITRGDLFQVSVFTFGSSVLSSSAGCGHFVVFSCLSLPRCKQHKWVPVNLMLGVTLQHPIQWWEELLLVPSYYRQHRSAGLMSNLAWIQTSPYTKGSQVWGLGADYM